MSVEPLFVLLPPTECDRIIFTSFQLQGSDVIAAILDLNSSRVLMMMDVSPASVTPTAPWTKSAILFRGSVSAKQKPEVFSVTPVENTFMAWTSLVARPATVMLPGPSLGRSVTRAPGSAAVSPMLEANSVMDVWRGTSAYSKIILSSACPVTVIRWGQWMALCCVTNQQDSVLANQE